jgi:hypothetical protein
MPKVGNKEFSYTKKGMAAAKKAAKDTDQEVQYKMGGGYMMRNKPIAMREGGSLKMVKNESGDSVPFYAADGEGKMAYGGKVKKMRDGGGMCRGMGAATKGGKFKMA